MLLKAEASSLLVIDLQEKLVAALHEKERLLARAAVLMKAAAALSVPMVVSEQYPKGLGGTVKDLDGLYPPQAVVEKTAFSCCREPAWTRAATQPGRPQAVVCGAEAHVCVLQTCLELAANDVPVFVVADAISSRTPENHAAALERLRQNGVSIVTTEMVLFEWMGASTIPQFREVSALIK